MLSRACQVLGDHPNSKKSEKSKKSQESRKCRGKSELSGSVGNVGTCRQDPARTQPGPARAGQGQPGGAGHGPQKYIPGQNLKKNFPHKKCSSWQKNSFHAAKLVFEVGRRKIFFCPLGIPLGPGHHISPTSKGLGDLVLRRALPGIFSHFPRFRCDFGNFSP